MTPDIAKTVVLIAYVSFFVLSFAIKVQSLPVPVAKSRIGVLEVLLVIVGVTGLLLPILWLATSDLAFADYGAHLLPLTAGSLCYASGLWLLGRVAWNLGKFWSPMLQLKENHRLVTKGVYRKFGTPCTCPCLSSRPAMRWPSVPNYVAGPSFLVAMLIIIAFRVGPDERMLLEEFGKEYEAYRKRSNRLIPGLW